MKENVCTAIISDLHLSEAEPINTKFPLWKKFRTREFFYDDALESFFEHIHAKANGRTLELILNGDIFDFDSVTRLPAEPVFRIGLLERLRGLDSRPERSKFKIEEILKDHAVFVRGLKKFLLHGHRVIFVIGNHDLELHYPGVQKYIVRSLDLPENLQDNVRFTEWFYISGGDTLIEHGNQYDPYCVCEDPINPFIQGYNYRLIRLPFGNQACRYIMNGLGFFNPHVDKNYIMTISEYIRFFLKYMLRAQPDLMLTWFFGAVVTLWKSFIDSNRPTIRDPLQVEARINDIAAKANAEPAMVRELRELFVESAAKNPVLLARELWLDRAFLILLGFFAIFEILIIIRQIYEISFFWALIPLAIFVPFFLFYSQSITSLVSSYKEPSDKILAVSGAIAGVQRVVYGHTHIPRHEMIGGIEHLNSGTWSPAFLDVECTRAFDKKNFVWIEPDDGVSRRAQLLIFRTSPQINAGAPV